jgi:hypothetical protein
MVENVYLFRSHERDLVYCTVDLLDDHRHGRVESIREVISSTSPKTLPLPVFLKTVEDPPGR